MKLSKSIKYIVLAGAMGMGFSSCNDFLDRPAEDNYNVDTFYTTDEQCFMGVNYLYNSPWYDFIRGYIRMGEVMSGNYYMGSSPYLDLSVNGTDENLVSMSYSLWAEIGHANTVYRNLGNSEGPSEQAKNTCRGECLAWKAMAYFYLVRAFGEVPIVHDNAAEISGGTYNDKYKVKREDVYEYIVMTLEEAMKLLPRENKKGRLDYYCAEALLSKVYLTKAGLNQSGQRNQADLDKAAEYAKDVIDNSGRNLLPVYSDIFRLVNNDNEEALYSWKWSAGRDPWTQQNSLQSDLAPQGFDEFGDCWGQWAGPSVDLQDAFGVDVINTSPDSRIDTDARRKATMMLPGDKYEYFWTDKGGFDPLRFSYDPEDYGKGGPGDWLSPTGAMCVKHLYGNTYDHVQALGTAPDYMANGLATHILRLADIYLVYAEAVLGNAASTSDPAALQAFNAVRSRSMPNATQKTSITFEDVWKERRLELAFEGDRWFDYVRRSYYDVQGAIADLSKQRRNCYWNLSALFKYYYENGVWDLSKAAAASGTYEAGYDTSTAAPNVTPDKFVLPFPSEDVVFNPHLSEPAISVDVRSVYAY